MTKLRSIASAIALLVIAPAPSAMAQLLDGLNLPLDIGGVTDILGGGGVDANGVSIPVGGGTVDVTVGGPAGLVDVNVNNVDVGGALTGLGVGDPGVVDVGIDAGNIANFSLAPGVDSGLTILPGGNPLENPGATVNLGILGIEPTIHINRHGELLGIHLGLPGGPEDPDPNPGPNPIDPNGGGGGPNAGPGVNPAQITEAVANLSDSSVAQRRALRTRCRGIMASPDQFDEALVALCAALQ